MSQIFPTAIMLAETGVAAYLLIWLTLFFSVNLRSILKFRRRASDAKTSGENKRPFRLAVGLVALGTFVYFAVVLLFSFTVFVGQELVVIGLSLGYGLPFMIYVQVLGLGLTALGYVTFMWSVIARGRYAVSWDMPENQKLVTWDLTVTCGIRPIWATSSCSLDSSTYGLTCSRFFHGSRSPDITRSLLTRRNS